MADQINRFPYKQNPLQHIRFQGGKSMGKARCEEGWNWQPPPLPDYDLWYVLSGTGQMRLQDKEYAVGKGSCFLIRPGDQPQAKQDPHDRLVVIFMHFSILNEGSEEISADPDLSGVGNGDFPKTVDLLPPRHSKVMDTYAFEGLLHQLLIIGDSHDLWKEDEFDYVMKQIWLHLYRLQFQQEHPDAYSAVQAQTISKVMARIREEGGKRIAHDELAALAQLSPRYLSQLFKRVTGISLKEYITKVRLERAMHLLTETSMNVSQVAHALEYANIYIFSKQFKKHYGFPPSHIKGKFFSSTPHGGSVNHEQKN